MGMKKSRPVGIVIGVTLALLVFLGGYFAGQVRSGVRITAERTPSAETDTGRSLPEVAGTEQEREDDGLLDINIADVEELTELPGIGETLAGRIVAYREEHGPFLHIEGLQNVEGIGPGKYEAIKDRIKVG